MADVEKKAFALLLAVVADIDSGFGLLCDDPAQRLLPESLQFGRIDRFAARPANMQPGQLGGRGRLPVWVVRMRSSLRRIVAPSPQISSELCSLASKARSRSGAIANNSLASRRRQPLRLAALAQQLKGGDPVSSHKPRSSLP